MKRDRLTGLACIATLVAGSCQMVNNPAAGSPLGALKQTVEYTKEETNRTVNENSPFGDALQRGGPFVASAVNYVGGTSSSTQKESIFREGGIGWIDKTFLTPWWKESATSAPDLLYKTPLGGKHQKKEQKDTGAVYIDDLVWSVTRPQDKEYLLAYPLVRQTSVQVYSDLISDHDINPSNEQMIGEFDNTDAFPRYRPRLALKGLGTWLKQVVYNTEDRIPVIHFVRRTDRWVGNMVNYLNPLSYFPGNSSTSPRISDSGYGVHFKNTWEAGDAKWELGFVVKKAEENDIWFAYLGWEF